MADEPNCLQLPIPQLPPISGGLSIPLFSFSFSADFNLCCHLKLFDIPPINIGGIPLTAALFAAINADIATVDAYLAELDVLAIKCPFD